MLVTTLSENYTVKEYLLILMGKIGKENGKTGKNIMVKARSNMRMMKIGKENGKTEINLLVMEQ